MQGTGTDRRKRIVLIVIAIVILALTIFLDQWTKSYFKSYVQENGKITVINGFFYITYTVNTGAAWSFLAGVSWGQTFFKILTSVALVIFVAFYVYALMKNFKWLQFSVVLILGGTIGNFIDRIVQDGVTDFISFVFGKYGFPIFNLADTFLVVGVIMVLVHYLFLDSNAIFKKKDGNKDLSNK